MAMYLLLELHVLEDSGKSTMIDGAKSFNTNTIKAGTLARIGSNRTNGGGGVCVRPRLKQFACSFIFTSSKFHIALQLELFLDHSFLNYQGKSTMT